MVTEIVRGVVNEHVPERSMTFTEVWDSLPRHSSTPAPQHIGDEGSILPARKRQRLGQGREQPGPVKILANSFLN